MAVRWNASALAAIVLVVGAIPSTTATAAHGTAPVATTSTRAALWVPRSLPIATFTLPAGAARAISLATLTRGAASRVQRVSLRITTGRAGAPGTLRISVAGTNTAATVGYPRRVLARNVALANTGGNRWRIRNLGPSATPIRVASNGYWREAPSGSGGPSPSPGGPGSTPAPVSSDGRLDLSAAQFTDVWVDPVNGSDSANGSSRQSALRTVSAAWNRIPANASLSTGVRIQLVGGVYPQAVLPNYWENRWGTAAHPVILNSADGPHSAVLRGDINMFNTRHFYLTGVDIVRDGDAFHCELCSHILIRNATLNGDANTGGDLAHEVIKVNQSDHLYLEDSTVRGADDNSIDFVAVQYGHMLGNRVSHAQDWCGYVKGGSAHLTVAENEFYSCGTGGFTAGQGAGIEFMTAPWINYEAVGVRVVNNIVHDTAGAGLGVNGGYNILLAYNTLYRVGSRSHGIEVVFGIHSCDAAHASASTAACTARVNAGGWGTANTADTYIGNKHVYVYNNVLLNPTGFRSQWEHFAIYGPRSQSGPGPAPNPARTDTDLRIAGNVIWNGPADLPLGTGDACGPTNPTCTAGLIAANNSINSWQPALTDPADGDFSPMHDTRLATEPAQPIPDFGWNDLPNPDMGQSGTSNVIDRNRIGDIRSGWGRPGAL